MYPNFSPDIGPLWNIHFGTFVYPSKSKTLKPLKKKNGSFVIEKIISLDGVILVLVKI